jgi:WD40 repeat protein
MDEVVTKTKQDNIAAVKEIINPFPGLRPFGIEESHLFFGREGQSEDVLVRLSKNRFVAVIGASGTGKSSLIYCGLVPILYGGFIASAGSKWRIIVSRPGSGPIDNLADAIVKNSASEEPLENRQVKKSFYSALLRHSSLGLVESLRHLPNAGGENILLLVDQFEELFRYRISHKGQETFNESVAFVKLLVEAVNQTEMPVYIVLTMRSDFIGECAQFQELTTLINKSNYLIPQMTRNDFRDAILGPVAVGNATIEPALVQELLNDMGDNPDQLPILQHAMMRTWDYWLRNSDKDKAVGINDYEAIGKMEKALSEHANEAFDELNEEGKRICEILFKTITEKGSDNRGVRRPTRLEDIAEISMAKIEDVITVIEKFRVAGRSFLTPSYEIPLTKNSVVDLSHESLMRIWNRLKVWVDEESAAVQMYQRLSEASALFHEGKTGLWRPPDLQIALNWELKQQPTLAWAQRHNPAFERAMVFLHTSAKENEAEELNKIKLQKRALQRSRIIAAVLGTAAIISLGIMIYAQMQSAEAFKQNKRATQQSIIASIQKLFAEKNAKVAQEQKTIAIAKSKEAIRQKEFANEQSKIAQQNADSADKQRALAEKKTIEANEQTVLAEKNAKEALEQKSAAEKAQQEAFNRRMLSIAQSMAVKSQQIDEDKDLKALLAYQAFAFNEKYQGISHNPDIHAGLYWAMVAQNGRSFNLYKGHNDAINSLTFAGSSTNFYSSGSDGKILRWDLTDTTKKPVVIINNKLVNKCIDISHDGNLLVVGTMGAGLGILDLKTSGAEPRYFPNLGKNIESVCITSDGKSVIAIADSNLLEFNISNGAGIITGSVEAKILSLAVSPDGKTVATGTKNGKIILWDRSNGFKKEILFEDNKNQIHALAFSHNGEILASGGILGYLRTWNYKERKLINNVRGHTARITDIKFSPNDKEIATSSYDASVELWDASNLNSQPIKLKEHDSWVLSVAFHPFGDRLVSGSSKEDRLILWPTNTYDMAALVFKKIGRNFTQDEWNTYIGTDIKYEKTK